MTKVLNIAEVVEVVAAHVFVNNNRTIVTETPTMITVDGLYHDGCTATLRVRFDKNMVVIKLNSFDDHNGSTFDIPLLAADATQERIDTLVYYFFDQNFDSE